MNIDLMIQQIQLLHKEKAFNALPALYCAYATQALFETRAVKILQRSYTSFKPDRSDGLILSSPTKIEDADSNLVVPELVIQSNISFVLDEIPNDEKIEKYIKSFATYIDTALQFLIEHLPGYDESYDIIGGTIMFTDVIGKFSASRMSACEASGNLCFYSETRISMHVYNH